MRADRPNLGPLSSARLTRLTSDLRSMALKDVHMSTSVTVADWIKRVADDERRRDALRVREDEMAARKADLVRRNGARLIDELRAMVTRDVEAFRDAFTAD